MNDAAGLIQLEQLFSRIISIMVGVGFIGVLVMVVTAGIKYLTSAGEPKAVQSASQTITWALLGVLFMAVAWIILLLISAFTGVDLTVFNLRSLCGTQWC